MPSAKFFFYATGFSTLAEMKPKHRIRSIIEKEVRAIIS